MGLEERRVFVLIHGTFATGAPWTASDSPICCAIREHYPAAAIETYPWSGDNLQQVREQETGRLADWLLEHARKQPGPCRYVLVAHSHGGNIAVGIEAHAEAAKRIECVITLATPFLGYRVADKTRFPLAYMFSGLALSYFCFYGPILALSHCEWRPEFAILGYLIPIIALLAAVLVVWTAAEKIWCYCRSTRRSWLWHPPAADNTTNTLAEPKPTMAIPTLVLTSRLDEPTLYLRMLSNVSDLLQYSRGALTLAVCYELNPFSSGFRFLLGKPGFSQDCADLATSNGTTLPFGWPDAIRFGIIFSLVGAFVMLLMLLAVGLLEAVWITVAIIPLHFFRGSQALSEFLTPLRLSRLGQLNFGERFKETLFQTVDVKRAPSKAGHILLRWLRFPRAPNGLLHSGICLAPATFDAIFDFVDAGCRTRHPEYSGETEPAGDPANEIWQTENGALADIRISEPTEPGTEIDFVPLFGESWFTPAGETEIIRGLLESCGILVHVSSRPQFGAAGLYVPCDQLELARAIINARRVE